MSVKTKSIEKPSPSNELVLTPEKPKRARKVIKWQPGLAEITCAAFALFLDNRDADAKKMALVASKMQYVIESAAKTVKDGKADADMLERRDNLELAMAVAGINNNDILEAIDRFTTLFSK